jgi:hypothetical protein
MVTNNAKLSSISDAMPTSEIGNCLTSLRSTVSRLEDRVDDLAGHLQPVTRPAGLCETTKSAQPREMLSPLGDEIRNLDDRVENALVRINGLLNGLAV